MFIETQTSKTHPFSPEYLFLILLFTILSPNSIETGQSNVLDLSNTIARSLSLIFLSDYEEQFEKQMLQRYIIFKEIIQEMVPFPFEKADFHASGGGGGLSLSPHKGSALDPQGGLGGPLDPWHIFLFFFKFCCSQPRLKGIKMIQYNAIKHKSKEN